jgi:RNA polymerase sigma factor (TIGR02999 family)
MSLIDESDMPPSEEGTRAASVAARDGLLSSGDRLRELFEIVYAELRRVAHRHLGGERVGHTLGTTGLVHEAYLELARLEHIEWPGRAYVLAAASQAMRRILIDYALARCTKKRGGGVANVPLDDAVAMAVSRSDTLLALDEALDRLAALSPRSARVVECRFFGGMTIEETAEALAISPATVKREWGVARAYLNRELAP